jgi:hypothetical protein
MTDLPAHILAQHQMVRPLDANRAQAFRSRLSIFLMQSSYGFGALSSSDAIASALPAALSIVLVERRVNDKRWDSAKEKSKGRRQTGAS